MVSKRFSDFIKLEPHWVSGLRLWASFWQANRFALDDRSLSESLGSTGPGQYEAGSDGIQMGVIEDFPALISLGRS